MDSSIAQYSSNPNSSNAGVINDHLNSNYHLQSAPDMMNQYQLNINSNNNGNVLIPSLSTVSTSSITPNTLSGAPSNTAAATAASLISNQSNSYSFNPSSTTTTNPSAAAATTADLRGLSSKSSVTYDPATNSWTAALRVGQRLIELGSFPDETSALRAYMHASIEEAQKQFGQSNQTSAVASALSNNPAMSSSNDPSSSFSNNSNGNGMDNLHVMGMNGASSSLGNANNNNKAGMSQFIPPSPGLSKFLMSPPGSSSMSSRRLAANATLSNEHQYRKLNDPHPQSYVSPDQKLPQIPSDKDAAADPNMKKTMAQFSSSASSSSSNQSYPVVTNTNVNDLLQQHQAQQLFQIPEYMQMTDYLQQQPSKNDDFFQDIFKGPNLLPTPDLHNQLRSLSGYPVSQAPNSAIATPLTGYAFDWLPQVLPSPMIQTSRLSTQEFDTMMKRSPGTNNRSLEMFSPYPFSYQQQPNQQAAGQQIVNVGGVPHLMLLQSPIQSQVSMQAPSSMFQASRGLTPEGQFDAGNDPNGSQTRKRPTRPPGHLLAQEDTKKEKTPKPAKKQKSSDGEAITSSTTGTAMSSSNDTDPGGMHGGDAKSGNKTSRFRGVCWYKRTSKWVVQTKINGKRIHIGYFADEEEAARAYDAAIAKLKEAEGNVQEDP